jgi:hypothetical protein
LGKPFIFCPPYVSEKYFPIRRIIATKGMLPPAFRACELQPDELFQLPPASNAHA